MKKRTDKNVLTLCMSATFFGFSVNDVIKSIVTDNYQFIFWIKIMVCLIALIVAFITIRKTRNE